MNNKNYVQEFVDKLSSIVNKWIETEVALDEYESLNNIEYKIMGELREMLDDVDFFKTAAILRICCSNLQKKEQEKNISEEKVQDNVQKLIDKFAIDIKEWIEADTTDYDEDYERDELDCIYWDSLSFARQLRREFVLKKESKKKSKGGN